MGSIRHEKQPTSPAAPVELPAQNDEVDEAVSESYPASDPPDWSPLHIGTPAPPPVEPNDQE